MKIHLMSLAFRVDTEVSSIVVCNHDWIVYPISNVGNIASLVVISSEAVEYVVVGTRAMLTV